MKLHYYDPMFNICSEKMPFTIRIEFRMNDTVDGEILSDAFQTAIRRYPYFSVKVIEENGELLTVHNNLPPVVYKGPQVYPLGGEEVNGHMFAISYEGKTISFFASHVITDGCGFFPFSKTVLYYYLCKRHSVSLDPTGIRLADDPFFEDECDNPYPEEKMRDAEPLFREPKGEYFRLKDGRLVHDSVRTVYTLRIREDETIRFTRGHDSSPCALCSSLMTKAIWNLHPEEHRDLVSAVSYNYRAAIGNRNNYRMLCNALKLRYPERLRNEDITKICTCTRGMVTVRMQPENVLAYAEEKRQQLEKIAALPTLAAKKQVLGEMALQDSIDNTFSVSFVGNLDYGSLAPYIESIRNFTDGSVHETIFLEVTDINGWFYINFLQGFSTDVYYKSFLEQLTENGIAYEELGSEPFCTADIVLP